MLVPHTWRGLFRLMCVAALAALLTLTTTSYVFAHEGRKVHGYELDVGFLTEPVYEGQPNAVYYRWLARIRVIMKRLMDLQVTSTTIIRWQHMLPSSPLRLLSPVVRLNGMFRKTM